jgi:hypothetical protein
LAKSSGNFHGLFGISKLLILYLFSFPHFLGLTDSVSRMWQAARPSRVTPAIERPDSDSLAPSTPAAQITAARYSNYAKNRSQAAPPPILNALFAPALKAFSMSGLQCLYLPMNHATLHLAEHRFTFFQGETDRFRPRFL